MLFWINRYSFLKPSRSLSPTISATGIACCRWLLHCRHPDFLPVDEAWWGLSTLGKLKECRTNIEAERKIQFSSGMLPSVHAPQPHRSHGLVSLKDYFARPRSVNSWSVGVTEQSLTSDILCSVAEAGDGAALEADLAIKLFQHWRSRMDTNQGFGKPLLQYLFLNTLTALFLDKWVFHMCGAGRSLMTYSWGLKESTKTRDWGFSGNFRKSDSVKFHHLFRNLRSSKRLSNNLLGLKVFQALLEIFPSEALSPERPPQSHTEAIGGVRAWLVSAGDTGKREP